MCDIVEEYAKERAAEAEKAAAKKAAKESAREYAKNFFINGADFSLVRKSITGLSESELLAIQKEVLKHNK